MSGRSDLLVLLAVIAIGAGCGRYGPPERAAIYREAGTARPVEPSRAMEREAVGGRRMKELEMEEVYDQTGPEPAGGERMQEPETEEVSEETGPEPAVGDEEE